MTPAKTFISPLPQTSATGAAPLALPLEAPLAVELGALFPNCVGELVPFAVEAFELVLLVEDSVAPPEPTSPPPEPDPPHPTAVEPYFS